MTFRDAVGYSIVFNKPICRSSDPELWYVVTFTPYFWLLYQECGTLVDQSDMHDFYVDDNWELCYE